MANQIEPNYIRADITGRKVFTEPPKHEWTCKNCRHWKRRGDMILGDCHKVNQFPNVNLKDSISMTISQPLGSQLPFLFGTGEDFGCIKFEAK